MGKAESEKYCREGIVSQILRAVDYACGYGPQECADDALRLYREMMKDPVNKRINPDLMRVVPCYAIRYGGMAEWNFAYSRYKVEDPEGANSFYWFTALSCTKQPWLLQRLLDMSLDNTYFRSPAALFNIFSVSGNVAARDITWNFIKNNFLTLHDKHGSLRLGSLIRTIASAYNMEYLLNELQSFANTTMAEEYQTTFQGAIKGTQANLDWLETNGDDVKVWLTEQGLAEYLP